MWEQPSIVCHYLVSSLSADISLGSWYFYYFYLLAYFPDHKLSKLKTFNEKNFEKKMEQDGQPKWRGDPIESFSDWKIEIIVSDNDDGDDRTIENFVYHVHKTFLAFGPRRSEYFSRLFRGKGKESGNTDDDETWNLELGMIVVFKVFTLGIYSTRTREKDL